MNLFTGNGLPDLSSVNDSVRGGPATAHVFDVNGRAHILTYRSDTPSPLVPDATGARPVDAVTAVLMADQVNHEFVVSPELDAGSDWVVTMSTKPFYTDPLRMGSGPAISPFTQKFQDGKSKIWLWENYFNRQSHGPGRVCFLVYCFPSLFPGRRHRPRRDALLIPGR